MTKKFALIVLSIAMLYLLAGCQQSGGASKTESSTDAAPAMAAEKAQAETTTPAPSPTARPLSTATPTPAFTPSAVDEPMARAAVDGFLSALVRGEGQQGIELWCTAQARQSYTPAWLEQIGRPDGYQVVESGWQGGPVYQARAKLQQGQAEQATITLEIVPERGLWMVDKITVGKRLVVVTKAAASPAVKAAQTPQPKAGNTSLTEKLPGKMAFITGMGGQVYIINPDGSGMRAVGNVAGMDPALSPDGTKIAYARWTDPRGIWVANVDGSDQHLYHQDNSARGPAWSPDGKQIVFWQYKEGPVSPKRRCWQVSDGGAPHVPADAWDVEENDTNICWSEPPDPHYQLALVTLPSGEYKDLKSDMYSYGPTWSPDGKAVAYQAEKGLALSTLDGGQSWLSNEVHDAMPAWSPDGKYIAFQYWSHDHWEIIRANSDGSGRVTLVKSTPLADKAENNAMPVWSPDSKHIAFVTDRRGRWEFWVMNADGSAQCPLFTDGLPGGMAVEYKGVREHLLSWSK